MARAPHRTSWRSSIHTRFPEHVDATPPRDARTPTADAAADGMPSLDARGPRDAATDVAPCQSPPGDAMPEGGGVPNPGSVECNASFPLDAGRYCDTRAGQFCCRGVEPADGGTPPSTMCQLGTGSAAVNLASCLTNETPVECDETSDCPDASICCFAPNPDPNAALRGQYVKACAPPGSDGGCDLSASYPSQLIGSPQMRLCKRNYECGPCGTCHVYCCEGSQTIEACESPSQLVCTVGLCASSGG